MNNHTTTITLEELHDDYVERVNLAVSEGRDDLIEALSAGFTAMTSTAHAKATATCPH